AEDGTDLPGGGGALTALSAVDLSGLDPRLDETEVVLAADVDNPLLGPRARPRSTGRRRARTPPPWRSWRPAWPAGCRRSPRCARRPPARRTPQGQGPPAGSATPPWRCS